MLAACHSASRSAAPWRATYWVLGGAHGASPAEGVGAWLRLSHNRNEQECSEKGVEEGFSRGSHGAHRAQLPLLKLHTRRRRGVEAEVESGSRHFSCAALSKFPPRGSRNRNFTASLQISPKHFHKDPCWIAITNLDPVFFKKTPNLDCD